jgi:hypothetical protein
MRLRLSRHPDSRSLAAAQIEVEIARPAPHRLTLSYGVDGALDDIRFPPKDKPARTDELWRHTCFEAFIRAPSGSPYYEFNFSPSTRWAAYRFSGYRNGMGVAEVDVPLIESQRSAERYTLRASLDLDRLPELPREALWRLGLSALIEDMNGSTSYWALAHPPGKPDFHHPDCFAHALSPVSPA